LSAAQPASTAFESRVSIAASEPRLTNVLSKGHLAEDQCAQQPATCNAETWQQLNHPSWCLRPQLWWARAIHQST